MNLTPFVISGSLALLPLLATGCKPQASDAAQLEQVMKQNSQLRRDISRMEALIRQAGDPVPDLPDKIAKREQELEASVEELKKLTDLETEQQLRALALQGRLADFQDRFERLQDELNHSPQP